MPAVSGLENHLLLGEHFVSARNYSMSALQQVIFPESFQHFYDALRGVVSHFAFIPYVRFCLTLLQISGDGIEIFIG